MFNLLYSLMATTGGKISSLYQEVGKNSNWKI